MKPAGNLALWCGLDLGWVYSDLLLSISRRTRCVHRARDILHDSLLKYVLTQRRDEIVQPHAYLRTVVSAVLFDHHRDSVRYQPFAVEAGDGRTALSEAPHFPGR